MYSYNYNYDSGSHFPSALIGFFIIISVVTILIGILLYVFQAYSFYTIAKNRGIKNPWMMWIPFANYWAIGELGEYYYNMEGAPKKNLPVIMLCISLGCLIPIINIFCAIALLILYYVIIYKIFNHTNPQNATLFLVLSIIFSVTLPFFLFSVRNKMDITFPNNNQYGQQVYQHPPINR